MMHRAYFMMRASKERKGVVKEEANKKAGSSYPKCEMSRVPGAHSRLAFGRHGRERGGCAGSSLCDWLQIERS